MGTTITKRRVFSRNRLEGMAAAETLHRQSGFARLAQCPWRTFLPRRDREVDSVTEARP
jgi:hypothetical protein